MVTPVSGDNIDTWLTINRRPLLFRAEKDNQAIGATEYHTHLILSTRTAPADLELFIDGEKLETEHYGRWTWRPKDYAGLYEVYINASGQNIGRTFIRVFPQKLTLRLYEQMNQDIGTVALDLLYCLRSPATEHATTETSDTESSPLRNYKKIKAIIGQMGHVMEQIRHQPYQGLRQQTQQQHWHEIKTYTGDAHPLPGTSIQFPLTREHRTHTLTLPVNWQVTQSHTTYDIYENRLLKQFLKQQLVARLSRIEEHTQNEIRHLQEKLVLSKRHGWEGTEEDQKQEIQRLRFVIADCQQMKQRCLSWCDEAFLAGVRTTQLSGKATQVLLKHPAYSRFYSLFLLSQQQLKTAIRLDKSISELALRKVSTLYEIWSVFQVTNMAVQLLLEAGYTPLSDTLFYEVESDYFHVDVSKNTACILLSQGDLRVEFKYEPVYLNQRNVHNRPALIADLYGSNPYLTPDMAIEIYKHEIPQHVIIFDAKYRYQRENDGFYYAHEDDIDKMRAYRDKIRYKTYDPRLPLARQRLQKIVSNASILFPGNRSHLSADRDIGALPLIPNMSPARRQEINNMLKGIMHDAGLLASSNR